MRLSCTKYIFSFLLWMSMILDSEGQLMMNVEDEKNIHLYSVGEGETREQAIEESIKLGLTNAYHSFFLPSAKESVDSIINREIKNLIQKCVYKQYVISETKSSSNYIEVNIHLIASLNKMKSFLKERGFNADFILTDFLLKIEQTKINEEAEMKTAWSSLFTINPLLHQSFDYTITAEQPRSFNQTNSVWSIPVKINVSTNEHIEFVFRYLKAILRQISLTTDEEKEYLTLNLPVYSFVIDNEKYILRKKETLEAFSQFFSDFYWVMRNFYISDGVKGVTGHDLLEKSCGSCGEWTATNYTCFYVFNANYNDVNGIGNEHPSCSYDNHDGPFSGFEKTTIDTRRLIQTVVANNFESKKRGSFLRTYSTVVIYSLSELSKIQPFKVESNFKNSPVGSWFKGGRIFFIDRFQTAYISPIPQNANTYLQGVVLPSSNSKDTINYLLNKIKTDTSIGSGKSNTNKLLQEIYYETTPFFICSSYIFHGLNDWFLPSQNEMLEFLKFSHLFMNKNPDLGTCPLENGIISQHCGVRDFATSTIYHDRYREPLFYSIEGYYDKYSIISSRSRIESRRFNLLNSDGYIRVIPIRTHLYNNEMKSSIDYSILNDLDSTYKNFDFNGSEPEFNALDFDVYMRRYIERNISEIYDDGKSGTCEISFVVSEDGTVSEVEAVNMKETALSRVAIEAILKGPMWKPALNANGRPVSYKMTKKITFLLPKD
jgi:hypothetical protein